MKASDRLIWWLFAGSTGGTNRARIIKLLMEEPCNLNKISERLDINYKTAQHHIRVLEEHDLLTGQGERYGRIYFVSPLLEENLEIFEKIWVRIMNKDLSDEKDKVST